MRAMAARARVAAHVLVLVVALSAAGRLRATARGMVWGGERLADLADRLESAAEGGCEGRR